MFYIDKSFCIKSVSNSQMLDVLTFIFFDKKVHIPVDGRFYVSAKLYLQPLSLIQKKL